MQATATTTPNNDLPLVCAYARSASARRLLRWRITPSLAMYDAKKPIRLVGKLTKVEWAKLNSFDPPHVTDAKENEQLDGPGRAGPGAALALGIRERRTSRSATP